MSKIDRDEMARLANLPREQLVEELRHNPRKIQVPFLKGEIGLGDAVKRVTSALGVKPCGACQRRADALNARFRLTGKR